MKHHNIFKTVLGLLLPAILAPSLTSCRDEYFISADDVMRQDNLPVELVVNLPEALTRSINPKKTFETGELIHVQGAFLMDDNTTEYKYGAFQFVDGKWEEVFPEGTVTYRGMTWPNNCITAEFTAYFISGTTSILSPTDDPQYNPVTLLSDVARTGNNNPDQDPLVARSTGPVKYGHTIVLNFIHACAYLIVEDMPPGIATNFWFTQLGNDNQPSQDFKNAFRLTLNMQNRLVFEFVQQPDPAFDNTVYVAGASESTITNGIERASFGVFLPPGTYDNFVVGYPGSDNMNIYMRYQQQNSTNEANPDNTLEENGVYTFNLSKSAGISIFSPPQGEVWDDDEDPIYPVVAKEFIYRVCNGMEYTITYDGEPVKILESVGSGTRLLKNINMQWAEYDILEPEALTGYLYFSPDLNRGNTFDGNYHWIWNLGAPLLNNVNGVVKNLGITNADMTFTSQTAYQPADDSGVYNLARRGAICNFLQEGSLENIRIRTKLPYWYEDDVDPGNTSEYYKEVFNITANVYAYESQESHNIGGLVGSNLSGTINRITIMTNINVTVNNLESESTSPTLSIGGIAGQSVSTMTDIGTENSPVITVTNNCSFSNGAFYVGGITGYHSGGTISNVILPDVQLEARNSRGFNSYMGGAAGGLSNAIGGELLNCSVSGTVHAGRSSMNNYGVAGSSYTGGLAGECYQSYTVRGCRSVVDVYGPTGQLVEESGVTYGTGGMFGKISQQNIPGYPAQTPDLISDNIAAGDILFGPDSYIGNFAGVVPEGETWADDYEGRAIIVVLHSNVPNYIGNEQ